MLEKQIITKNKRKPLKIEIPNKEITFCETKKLNKYKFNYKSRGKFFNKSNLKNNLEDDYESYIYDESICKDQIFFENKYLQRKESMIRSTSNILNYKKNFFDKSDFIVDYFDKNYKINSKLNLSFENKNQNLILDNDKTLLNKDKSENYQNLMKIINLFAFVNKKIQNKHSSNNNESNILNDFSNNIKTNFTKKTSKFSRKKSGNNISITDNINNIMPIHNRNITELYIDLEKGIPINKIIKLEKHNNSNNSKRIINKENINSNNIKRENFKIYNSYILNSLLNNTFEQEKEIIIKGRRMNKSMRKININLNKSAIENNILVNKSKAKNLSLNYSNPKRIKSEKKIKRIINSYMNKEKDGYSQIIYQSNKNEDIGEHKIIKKRVILEEEYMINSEGDQRLLSIRRLDNGNNNEQKNNYKCSQNYNIKDKTMNNENSKNKDCKLNNSFLTSIFKDNPRKSVYNNRIGIKSTDEDSQISYIFNNHNSTKRNIKKSKNIITNPSLINNHSNKLSSKAIKKIDNKIPMRTEKQNKEQKINKDSGNKELNLKKKLFFNRIYINKFNKNNNNSKMNFHPNYINSNRSSMNYLDDKDKSKYGNKNGIYNKISFPKKQPFMIYHNEEKNQNFYINNNQNCANMVNIVFLNNGKNKTNKGSERPKPVCGLKRSNMNFNDIKSISIDKNDNSLIKSTRNHHKKVMNAASCDINAENKKNSFNIYSSMDNANDKRIKNLEILSYISSKPKLGMRDIKKEYIKKSGFNKSGISQYFIDYIE